MICRVWRGSTTPENAEAYESVVRGQVIPGIEAMRIPGSRHIDLMRRDLDGEVEFLTIMWFDDIASITAFVGEDYEVSHVPARGPSGADPVRRPVGPLCRDRPPTAGHGAVVSQQ